MRADAYPDRPLDIRILVPPELGGVCVADALAEIASISSDQARFVIQFGAVKVNGSPCIRPSAKLKAGARMTVSWRPVAGVREAPLTVVLEDADLLVVDKPPGRPVQATRLGRGGSIVEELSATGGGAWSPMIVHRLDVPVSGLLAIAKSQAAAGALSASLREGNVDKIYLALVDAGGQGRTFLASARTRPQIVDAPLKWLSGQRRAMVSPDGKACLSRILHAGEWQGTTVVAVGLKTGRSHQIRAHLAHSGLPVLGDLTYGGRGGTDRGRIALHSTYLAFPHPTSGAPLAFLQPPPADFWESAECEAPGRLPEQLVAAIRSMRV